MYLEKIQKNSGFENSEFEREREGERERERDPHLCSGSATPQNPPDGGNPSTMYLEKIQKNSEFENSGDVARVTQAHIADPASEKKECCGQMGTWVQWQQSRANGYSTI